MGLIKSNNAPSALAAFSMQDIEAQARAIVLRASQQAERVLAAAEVEGAKIRQKAYDEGFTAGREDGLKKGTEDGRAAGTQQALVEQRAKLEQLSRTLTAAIAQLDGARAQLESESATEVIKLAIAIARRVTKLQGSLDPTVVTENIRAAMRLAVHGTDVRIAVHPSQLQAMSATLPMLRVQWPNVSHVELVEDASLTPGGCRIFTASGQIDADLESQIDRVAADLLPSRASEEEAA
jgi:flagellar assembly protein FliH